MPEETCNLEPSASCKHVTKLVPSLQPNEECVDVPKEVCVRGSVHRSYVIRVRNELHLISILYTSVLLQIPPSLASGL